MDTLGNGLSAALRDARSGTWRVFRRPVEVISAFRVEDVLPALQRVEAASTVLRQHAAGFVAYEAAPAFDSAFRAKPPGAFPLVWFGVFDEIEECALDDLTGEDSDVAGASGVQWEPSISQAEYRKIFEALQQFIRAGDTYQVNFTYRLFARIEQNALEVFRALARAHTPPFGAFIDTGEWAVCSASPELFFHLDQHQLESRPMKGTAPRGLWFEQDLLQARKLRESEKERAENVMIVDMVRNDMGRIAVPGTVRVASLFDVERYPTVLQLTSTVSAETRASLSAVFGALFPPASITGAPKARTMEIIEQFEKTPRNVYTGAIGFVEPGGRAQFNVAIRTIAVEAATRKAEFGAGGGIVADSVVDEEWEESRLKSKVLESRRPAFDLLETMLWLPQDGYVLLGRHLKRLLQSADYFGYPLEMFELRERLDAFASDLEPSPRRVRLLLSKNGTVQLSASLQDPDQGFAEISLANHHVDSRDIFLYHKTTNRGVYEEALAGSGAGDALLFNERHEITESTIASVVFRVGDELFTPPVECGLLPGTLRAHLLDEGRLRERKIGVDDLHEADGLYLLNSVRGFHPVRLSGGSYRSVRDRSGL